MSLFSPDMQKFFLQAIAEVVYWCGSCAPWIKSSLVLRYTKAVHHPGQGAGVDPQEGRRLAFMALRFLQGHAHQVLGHGVQVKVPFGEQGKRWRITSWSKQRGS